MLVFAKQGRGVCVYRANSCYAVGLVVGRRSLAIPISTILYPRLTNLATQYLASQRSSFHPPFCQPSSSFSQPGYLLVRWSENCAPASVPMDQQPAPGAQPRASGSRTGHSEPPDEFVEVLAKSLQLGAGAGTLSTDDTPSLPHTRDADL